MLQRNLIIAFALFTAVNALPADKPSTALIQDENSEKSSWYSTFPLFSIFKPIIELFPNFADFGPKIEIGDKYTNIIIKAEHYSVDELNVQVKGRFVSIEGSKKTVHDERDLSTEFLYTASLPINANTSDVFAKFYSDNYLVVTTPNKGLNKKVVYTDRIVPILMSEEEYIKSNKNDNEVPITTTSAQEVTDKVAEVSTKPALADPSITTSTPEIISESQVIITTSEPKAETTIESVIETGENKLETSSEVSKTTLSLEEKEAKIESEELSTPSIEFATQNTISYIGNEIGNLEPITLDINNTFL